MTPEQITEFKRCCNFECYMAEWKRFIYTHTTKSSLTGHEIDEIAHKLRQSGELQKWEAKAKKYYGVE